MQIFLLVYLIVAGIACLGGASWFGFEIVTEVKEKKNKAREEQALVAASEDISDTEAIGAEAYIAEEASAISEADTESIDASRQTDGVEIVDITWKEHGNKRRTYRYATCGLQVKKGDVVLVSTFDACRNRELERKAVVCSDAYTVEPSELQFELKAILQVMPNTAEKY